ncbi:MAG: transposase [Gemmatimonadetes bacterium]|nr:transposase [Gemmatimonadota bacterium]
MRPGKTPSGPEVLTLIKHLVRRIRRHWLHTRIVVRGNSDYGRAEAMAWCEDNGVDYIFGIADNRVLHALAYEMADDLNVSDGAKPRFFVGIGWTACHQM